MAGTSGRGWPCSRVSGFRTCWRAEASAGSETKTGCAVFLVVLSGVLGGPTWAPPPDRIALPSLWVCRSPVSTGPRLDAPPRSPWEMLSWFGLCPLCALTSAQRLKAAWAFVQLVLVCVEAVAGPVAFGRP